MYCQQIHSHCNIRRLDVAQAALPWSARRRCCPQLAPSVANSEYLSLAIVHFGCNWVFRYSAIVMCLSTWFAKFFSSTYNILESSLRLNSGYIWVPKNDNDHVLLTHTWTIPLHKGWLSEDLIFTRVKSVCNWVSERLLRRLHWIAWIWLLWNLWENLRICSNISISRMESTLVVMRKICCAIPQPLPFQTSPSPPSPPPPLPRKDH